MLAFICNCRVHNHLKHFFLQLHKCVSLQNSSVLYHIQRNRYNSITFRTVIGLTKSVKWKHCDFQPRKICSYETKPNNEQLATIKENIARNDHKENNIDKRIELITSDIKRLGRVSKKDIDNLHNCIQTAGSCSRDQGVFLLQICGKLLPDVHPTTRTILALSVWKTLRQFKCPLILDHYNALLSSLADNKHPISVNNLLIEIQQDKLTLDASCCLSLLRCVCEVGDMKQATDIIKLMLDLSFIKNQQISDYIILGHGRAGDFKSVESMIGSQEEASTLTVVLKVSAEAGQKEIFNSYFKKALMLSEAQRLDVVVSLAMGNLNEFIPLVLSTESWSTEGIVQANNTSVHLVHLGYPEAGVYLLASLAKHTAHEETTFAVLFMKELLKSNTEVCTVIKICAELSKYNPRSLIKATEFALTLRQHDVSVELIQEMKKQGFPVRPHYFWPLLISASETQGKEGIMNILDTMLKMEVKPDFETLTNYVLPQLKFSKVKDVVRDLRNHGLILADVMTPALNYLLDNDRIQEAVELCSTYKTRIDWNSLMSVLAKSFIRTGNVESTVALLSFSKNSGPNILVQNIMSSKKKPVQPQHLELLLKILEDKGYTFSSSVHCQNQDLEVVNNNLHPQSEQMNITHPSNMNLEELECHLLELKAKQLNTRGVLRKLFQIHCRLGNLKRASEIKKDLLEGGYLFSSGMVASLFQLYTSTEQLDEGETCLKELQQNHPDFKIDAYKIVDFATVLVHNKRYSKALTILQNHQGRDGSNMVRNCWRLLNAVAAVEGVTSTKEVLKVLLHNNYSKVSGELLSPLINAHLQRNDLSDAVKEFESCFEEYGKTPMLYDMLCRLSKNTDHSLLEKVLSIGRKCHGVANTNVMYVMALAECNLSSQLLKVVQSPDFVLDSDKLLGKCSHFLDNDDSVALENIVNFLLAIPSVNVEPFCYLILQICIKHGNCDAALKLWTSMQESNVIPSDKFSSELKALITQHKPSSNPELK